MFFKKLNSITYFVLYGLTHGGEVILLCTGSKKGGTCPFKVRIRRTKVKNTEAQEWYIPKNGLNMVHDEFCQKLANLPNLKRRELCRQNFSLNKSPTSQTSHSPKGDPEELCSENSDTNSSHHQTQKSVDSPTNSSLKAASPPSAPLTYQPNTAPLPDYSSQHNSPKYISLQPSNNISTNPDSPKYISQQPPSNNNNISRNSHSPNYVSQSAPSFNPNSNSSKYIQHQHSSTDITSKSNSPAFRPQHPELSPNYLPQQIYTKSPRYQTQNQSLNHSPILDDYLVKELMLCLREKPEGSGGLNDADLVRVSHNLNTKIGATTTPYMVRSRFQELGKQFDIFVTLSQEFAWDNEKKKFNVSDDVHPEIKKIDVVYRLQKELTQLFMQLEYAVSSSIYSNLSRDDRPRFVERSSNTLSVTEERPREYYPANLRGNKQSYESISSRHSSEMERYSPTSGLLYSHDRQRNNLMNNLENNVNHRPTQFEEGNNYFDKISPQNLSHLIPENLQERLFELEKTVDHLNKKLSFQKYSVIEKAITYMQQSGEFDKDAIFFATKLFSDDRQAAIFCSLSESLKREWLQRQIQ
ncbi:hypothetical protein HK099_001303 [Clydaea vesicula]|uniref:Uncharacterized protein n=1 Tax=Clydaea vesicula TaxID=447962 RepID=A0AAD5TUE0_9FUNG|nr:hypothetical protein HK099_001303 [Clydaea vesicula]